MTAPTRLIESRPAHPRPEGESADFEFLVLGSDPFSEVAEPDPFTLGLDALGHEPAPLVAPPPAGTTRAQPAAELHSPVSSSSATPIRRRRWTTTPSLAEIELPERRDWLDRLLDESQRRRLAALTHLVEGEASYDRFGFSPEVARKTFPLFLALYRAYFRVRSLGSEHLPAEGPAILVSNHGGILPFDASMIVIDVLLHTDPPRLPRALVDRWAGSLPWINIFYARVGQVVGTRENFSDLLADGQLVLVFPEGMDGVRKRVSQRYCVQGFRVGFVEQALRAGVPIVPVAVLGSDDQAPILYDLKPLARTLGLPMLPITPTFPWFGPLGLLPYPVSYRIVYGEPIRFDERFGPEAAEDPQLVRYLTSQVRCAVQQLVDQHR